METSVELPELPAELWCKIFLLTVRIYRLREFFHLSLACRSWRDLIDYLKNEGRVSFLETVSGVLIDSMRREAPWLFHPVLDRKALLNHPIQEMLSPLVIQRLSYSVNYGFLEGTDASKTITMKLGPGSRLWTFRHLSRFWGGKYMFAPHRITLQLVIGVERKIVESSQMNDLIAQHNPDRIYMSEFET